MRRGRVCQAGGRCPADGGCPAFLGDCFANVNGLPSCDAYCNAKSFSCAAKSCNYDGSPNKDGYSSVSFPAAARATCQASGVPDSYSRDECRTLIWLSAQKPLDDVIRCCCRG